MPAEINNPYPMPTAEEANDWLSQTDPATAAARCVMTRRIDGLFRRPYLRGDSDHAPILQGVRDLTVEVDALLTVIAGQANLSDELAGAADRVLTVMRQHGCKPTEKADVDAGA